jgi:methionyl-tRNA formyltransferase
MNARPAFDTIILLTGAIEAAALAGVLGIRDPRLDVRHVASLQELDALAPAELARARLIAFSTDVIVPPRILDALGYGAYNFHPGPPNYPGWGSAHFATYDRAATFGVTAHVMVEKVDAGPIIGVELFCIPPDTTALRLEQLAFVALARIFWNLAQALTQSEAPAVLPAAWSGRKTTRRLYEELRAVPPSVAKDDLDRRVAAFGRSDAGDGLTVTLHGHKFRYVAPDADPQAEERQMLAVERFARRA